MLQSIFHQYLNRIFQITFTSLHPQYLPLLFHNTPFTLRKSLPPHLLFKQHVQHYFHFPVRCLLYLSVFCKQYLRKQILPPFSQFSVHTFPTKVPTFLFCLLSLHLFILQIISIVLLPWLSQSPHSSSFAAFLRLSLSLSISLSLNLFLSVYSSSDTSSQTHSLSFACTPNHHTLPL